MERLNLLLNWSRHTIKMALNVFGKQIIGFLFVFCLGNGLAQPYLLTKCVVISSMLLLFKIGSNMAFIVPLPTSKRTNWIYYIDQLEIHINRS